MGLNIFRMYCVIFVLVLWVVMASNNQIVDFQYTKYTQIQTQSNRKINLDFYPADVTTNIQLPQDCDLIDSLNGLEGSEATSIEEDTVGGHLESLKDKFLTLLKLSQMLTNVQRKIIQYEQLINSTNPQAPSSQKLAEVKEIQDKLKSLDSKISQIERDLQESLSTVQWQPKDLQIKQLEFKIQSLTQKIDYLRIMQSKSKAALINVKQINYTSYFQTLQSQFNNQNNLIENLNQIIHKKDRLNQLYKEKLNLQSSIKALTIYVQDVEQCYQESLKLKSNFKNHEKIMPLIAELKELKQNQEPNNKYCKGVVIKLTEKVKAMLKYYDIVESCASGLEEKKQQLENDTINLEYVIGNITELQKVLDITVFQNEFNEQSRAIKETCSQVHKWNITQYIRNPQKIALLRQAAESELLEIKREREELLKLAGDSASSQKVSHRVIDLINSIKQSKKEYDQLSGQLWMETQEFKSRMALKTRLIRTYNQQISTYSRLHTQMTSTKQQIFMKMN